MRVNIVVTGVAEQKGIVSFLEKIFDDVEFRSVRFDGFTSIRMSPEATVPAAANIPTNVAELATFFVEAVNSRGGEQFVLLEDLEVANLDQPSVVIQCFLNAVNAIVDKKRPYHKKTCHLGAQRHSDFRDATESTANACLVRKNDSDVLEFVRWAIDLGL